MAYPPQPVPLQYPPQYPPYYPPQRQFGVRDFIFGILLMLCSVAILIGFFGLPFIDVNTISTGAVGQYQDVSASRIVTETTSPEVVARVYRTMSDSRATAELIPYYALYGFIGFAVLFFIGAFAMILRAITRGNLKVGFFIGFLRIIVIPIIYIMMPLGILILFYGFALGRYNFADVVSSPSIFRLDVVRQMAERIPPGSGMLVILGACIIGALISMFATLLAMFSSPVPRGMMPPAPYGMPPQYGQPQYPPQYGQYPPNQPPPYQYPQYPPQYPPNQPPPYQQPPAQNPYGAPPSQPSTPPAQNPYEKPNDDEF